MPFRVHGVHGTSESHLFFRCLHVSHALTDRRRSSGRTLGRGIATQQREPGVSRDGRLTIQVQVGGPWRSSALPLRHWPDAEGYADCNSTTPVLRTGSGSALDVSKDGCCSSRGIWYDYESVCGGLCTTIVRAGTPLERKGGSIRIPQGWRSDGRELRVEERVGSANTQVSTSECYTHEEALADPVIGCVIW